MQKLALWLFMATALGRPAFIPAAEEPLRRNVEILQLNPVLGVPARRAVVHGVVSCFEPSLSLLFVQDASAGIYIYCAAPPPGLRPGRIVDVSGICNLGRFSPIIDNATVTITGEAPIPPPIKARISQLRAGKYDSQWIELTGTVRSINRVAGKWKLELAEDDDRFQAWILDSSDAAFPALLDAEVTVRGVAACLFGKSKQPEEFFLFVNTIKDVALRRVAVGDPFTNSIVALRDLAYSVSRAAISHRLHVRGAVTMQQPGQFFFLRDETGAVLVQSSQPGTLMPGDVVDVAGYLTQSGAQISLQDSVFRKTGARVPVSPKEVPIDRLYTDGGNYDLVSIEGEIMRAGEGNGNGLWLALSVGPRTLMTHFPTNAPALAEEKLRPGSHVKVTGVAQLHPGTLGQGQVWDLWSRDGGDVVILHGPPEDPKSGRAWVWAVTSAVLAGISLSLFMAVRGARKRVSLLQKRTQELKARSEAREVVYRTDSQGLITYLNEPGERLLGYARGEILGKSVFDLLSPSTVEAHREVLNPAEWQETPSSLELEFRAQNGSPIYLDAHAEFHPGPGGAPELTVVGLDVTQRKIAEKSVRYHEQQLQTLIEERERLSRDLHDEIIQSIYAIGIGLEDCSRGVPQDTRSRLEQTRGELNAVIRRVRQFISGIEEKAITGREFKTALKSLLLTLGETQARQIVLQIDPRAAEKLTTEQTAHLLNIAKEAITNSLRHGQANAIVVYLQNIGPGVRLGIKDDGRGFSPQSGSRGGFGLRNLESRVRELNAKLEIISSPGEGAHIIVEVP